MCGRYVLNAPEDLSERFQLRQLTINLPHTWNAAPTNALPVIFENEDGEREAELFQWGLIPRWAKPGVKKQFAPINARGETLGEKPMFRHLVKRKRCLVPSNGFYEWKNMGDHKQPYFINVPEDPLFAFAGLYDRFENDDGEEIATYTIVTTQANDFMRWLHDRMPVMLKPEDEDEWLDRDVEEYEQVERLLSPYPADDMEAVPVSRKVNNVRNDGPELLDPVEVDE